MSEGLIAELGPRVNGLLLASDSAVRTLGLAVLRQAVDDLAAPAGSPRLDDDERLRARAFLAADSKSLRFWLDVANIDDLPRFLELAQGRIHDRRQVADDLVDVAAEA
jgi:hypothetical protein